jgi:regulator of sirC expression with transglutaminase-like and TPR domain
MASRSEIESLLYLLDDPDPFVKRSVKSRFEELGEQVVPLLDSLRAETKNEIQKQHANDILHDITFRHLQEDLIDLLEQGINTRERLEVAILTLARFGTPTLSIKAYQNKLNHFAKILTPQIRYKLDERRKMKALLKFVFEDLNFSGDDKDYHHPDNCFLNTVIDNRKGLPISLSLVVIFLAQRLDLPFYGVNMPIHFMLNFIGEKEEVLIDPFDDGASVTYDQCYFFLKKNGIEPKPEHFQMASELDILVRVIRNLIHSYERMEQPNRVEDVTQLLNIVESYLED